MRYFTSPWPLGGAESLSRGGRGGGTPGGLAAEGWHSWVGRFPYTEQDKQKKKVKV